MPAKFMPSFFSGLPLCLFLLLIPSAWGQPSVALPHDHQARFNDKSPETGPIWAELSPQQQEVLKPLQPLWTEMEENRKRKWLAIAKTFHTLTPQAQATAQQRMREWAALTPLQRSQARLNFAQSKQMTADEKLAKWEAYQSLDDEAKQSLLKRKPDLPKGAATSPKPIAAEKLTSTPLPKDGQKKAPRIETGEVDPHTLLRVKKVKLIDHAEQHD